MTEETSNGSPGDQGRASRQEAANVADLAAIDRQRMLDGEKRGIGDHRGAVDRAAAAGGGQRNVDENDFPDGDRPLAGDESDLLAEVRRAVAEDRPPRGVEIAVGTGQFDDKLLARQIARHSARPSGRAASGSVRGWPTRFISDAWRNVPSWSTRLKSSPFKATRLAGGLVAQLARGRTVVAELPGGFDETVGEVYLAAGGRDEGRKGRQEDAGDFHGTEVHCLKIMATPAVVGFIALAPHGLFGHGNNPHSINIPCLDANSRLLRRLGLKSHPHATCFAGLQREVVLVEINPIEHRNVCQVGCFRRHNIGLHEQRRRLADILNLDRGLRFAVCLYPEIDHLRFQDCPWHFEHGGQKRLLGGDRRGNTERVKMLRNGLARGVE